MSGGALATAGALAATMTAAYRLGGVTSFLLGKTMEAAAGQAFELTVGTLDSGYQIVSKHSIQYILMELDVEAKVSSVRSLVRSIEHSRLEENSSETGEEDFVLVAADSLKEIMEKLVETLHRIYSELDSHAQKWFNSWRKPLVFDDLELLRAQCRVFDKRLDTLTKCLAIHLPQRESESLQTPETSAGELAEFSFYSGVESRPIEDRTTNITPMETLFYKDDAVVL